MPSDITTTPGKFAQSVKSMVGDIARQTVAAGKRAVDLAARDGHKHVVEVIGTIKPFKPVDNGELRRSYKVRMERTGHTWTAVLENVAPHAAHMEFGTRPHWAPLEPLVRWAERKLRKGEMKREMKRERDKKRRRGGGASRTTASRPRVEIDISGWSKAGQKRYPEAKRIAFRVREKIAQKGTEPREFHAKASQRFPLFMKDRLISELRKVR